MLRLIVFKLIYLCGFSNVKHSLLAIQQSTVWDISNFSLFYSVRFSFYLSSHIENMDIKLVMIDRKYIILL